jgi:hypothetical protein
MICNLCVRKDTGSVPGTVKSQDLGDILAPFLTLEQRAMTKTEQNRVLAWRLKFLREAGAEPGTLRRPVAIFGLSRQAYYKWKARFETDGEVGLVDGLRVPHRSPRDALREVASALLQGGKQALDHKTGIATDRSLNICTTRQNILSSFASSETTAFHEFPNLRKFRQARATCASHEVRHPVDS